MIPQYIPLHGSAESVSVARYLASYGWLTEHTETAEFERRIAEYVGVEHCIAFCNGTMTLFAILKALGIRHNDEVLVPDYTMVATANAVTLAGAMPVFVDVEPTTLCIDLEQAERCLTTKTKALMLVSLNGRSANMEQVFDFAKRHELIVIEDAAQAFGSAASGAGSQKQMLGTFGRAGSYSFSPHKIITTGQGGCVVTSDGDLAARLRGLKDFGRRQGGTHNHEDLGWNFKFTDLQAAFGNGQLDSIDWRVQRKREIFAEYRRLLAGVEQVRFIETDLSVTAPWFVDVMVPYPDTLVKHLSARGIGSRRMYPALHTLKPCRDNGRFLCESYRHSSYAAAHGLWLPSGLALTDHEIREVCRVIREFYGCRSEQG